MTVDDIEAIKQLKGRYCRTMDTKDWAAMRDVFTDDVEMDTTASGGGVIVGADEAVSNLGDAVWYWILIAIGFNVLAFAAYVALFRGVLGGTRDDDVHRRLDLKASYQITMAGLAATRIFSAAGAGGIVLTYWALRKAGVPRRRAACRMVAFLVLTYFVYTAALVVFGVVTSWGYFTTWTALAALP